jgi:CoA-transferase family III
LIDIENLAQSEGGSPATRPGALGDIKVFNLAQPAGCSVLFRIRKDADVVVENYLRGTLVKWALDCDGVLKALFPRLI